MTYQNAVALINAQERRISKVNGTRFIHNGYEYRITYRGGFAAYVPIDRRQVGRRNFKYFSGVGASDCWTVDDVMKLIMEEVERKNG